MLAPFHRRQRASDEDIEDMNSAYRRRLRELAMINDSVCDVCLGKESMEGNVIVLCDGCEVGVHQWCYGALGEEQMRRCRRLPQCALTLRHERGELAGIRKIPEGDEPWYCAVCQEQRRNKEMPPPRCVLCPSRYGAMKRTTTGEWVRSRARDTVLHGVWFC